jgi:hypothetical protein
MKSLFFIVTVALLAGCGGGNGTGTSAGTGTLQVSVTDAKIDEALAVVVHYTAVQIHGDTYDTTIDVTDPLTGDPGRSINLLDYTNGASTQLFDQELPAGHYQWMRLTIDLDPSKSYIELADGQHPLWCNSCTKNGLKLNRDFTIAANQTTAFTLDFNLRSSITFDNKRYHLRPTVRVVATDASGAIAGSVDPTVISSNDPDGNGCAVYVFNGPGATLDDVYVPTTGDVPTDHNNPATTAIVDPATQDYMTAFLTPGTYTVALTCDPELDMTASDEVVGTDMTFVDNQDASVTSGMTTTVDFN